MEADFSGYATKAGLKCTDGRTIMPEAFKHQDKARVPLVWRHDDSDPKNILGHAILEARDDGMYAYGFFNDTPAGKLAKVLLQHGDIDKLSIYANQLIERVKQVFHGQIREVSLVLAGANPGALIDYVAVRHGDGSIDELEDEAVIYTGIKLNLPSVTHADSAEGDTSGDAEETIQDVYDTMSEKQKEVLHYMLGVALETKTGDTGPDVKQSADSNDSDNSVEHGAESNDSDAIGDAASAATTEDTITHTNTDNTEDEAGKTDLSHMEGNEMGRNVFEQNGTGSSTPAVRPSYADIQAIVHEAQRTGSLKAAVESYALAHGVENLDVLFPDAQQVGGIEIDSRRMEWVAGVMSGVRKSPFSRIKTVVADLTFDSARAKGYVKGNLKKEEFFAIFKRVTTPQTIYKKQKLDRDDVIDITDLDIVTWIKGEMRIMLEEEIARAILIGDGRESDDEDKIFETNIRSIANDHEFYAVPVGVNLDDSESTVEELIDAVVLNRRFYKGSGQPTFYTSEEVLAKIMLLKDGMGHRLYDTVAAAANAMRVKDIVEVPVFEDDPTLVGIVVNLADYVVGADRGGQTSMFDDFDIDYNQLKYLIETRLSGALNKPKAALVVRKTGAADAAVVPTAPTFDTETWTLTIPTVTGVVYQNEAGDTLAAGDIVLTAGQIVRVFATAASGYYISGVRTQWSFLRPTGS